MWSRHKWVICRRGASVAACSKASRASPSMASLRWICWGSSALGGFLRVYSWVVRCFLTQCNHTQCIQRCIYSVWVNTSFVAMRGLEHFWQAQGALFVDRQPLILVFPEHFPKWVEHMLKSRSDEKKWISPFLIDQKTRHDFVCPLSAL